MIQAAGWVGRNVCYPMLGGALVYLFLSFFALGTTPLHLAARFNWPKAIEVLAAAGAPMDPPGAMILLSPQPLKSECFFRDVAPLHITAYYGHVQATKALLLAGASIEATRARGSRDSKETPLHVAAQGGHVEVIEALVLGGAFLEAQTGNGETPLHAAAARGHTKAIQSLVSAGASLEAQTGGHMYTPLHAAAREGTVEAIEALLAAGSSPEAQTDDGATPLVEAAARGHAGVVRALEAASSLSNAACANSPTEELPPQLPQTFDEWYATTRWWSHSSQRGVWWLLTAWSGCKYWPLQIQAPSWMDSLRANILAITLSTIAPTVAFAVQSSFDPCIVVALETYVASNGGSYTSYWMPICAWNPSEESMLAHARVDPSAVAVALCAPALKIWIACRLCWFGNSNMLALTNMFGGLLWALRRLWAVFPVRRLATRPRLRLSLRLLALCCIFCCWFLWICSTSAPVSLFMFAGLGVALDVEWWVVERPSAGICLAAAFFPRHTAVYACVSVAVASLHLIDPLVQAVRVGLADDLPELGWMDELGWAGRALLRANVIWRLFIELCINTMGDRMAPAALLERAMKLDTFPGNRPKHWPPSLIIPEALDNLSCNDATPREFVCPLTMGLMRLPAVTPQGTTYDYEAIASWVDARGRYPANESPELLSRPELAPNRVLRSMIEEWVAARSTAS